jgi:hypothetical protein
MSAESLKTTKVLDASPDDPRPAIDAAAKEADPDSAAEDHGAQSRLTRGTSHPQPRTPLIATQTGIVSGSSLTSIKTGRVRLAIIGATPAMSA